MSVSDEAMRDLEAAGVVEPDVRQLLGDLVAYVKRYVIFRRDAEAVAVALWVVHTHAFDAASVTPYLHASSPEKESGKSTLLEALSLVVARPWKAITPSEATLFRKIDKDAPTLLLDEVDTIFTPRNEREGLRAILNGGFERSGTIPRIIGEGKSMKTYDFKVFCPKAIAGIGRVPDTVASRSIPIRLQRKAVGEKVNRFRRRVVGPEAAMLRDAAAKWAAAHLDELRDVWPQLPDELTDRQQDVWEPLLAIADEAGPEWGMRARAAAVELHAVNDDDPTIGVLLLSHVRDALNGTGHITTAHLLDALVERDDGPWAEWWGRDVHDGNTRGPAARVGRLLKPYGIKSKKIRTGDKTLQGFEQATFEDVFRRYLPPVPTKRRNNGTPQVEGVFQAEQETSNQAPDQGCSDVPSSKSEGPRSEPPRSEPSLLEFDFPGGFGKCFVCDKLARSVWPEFEGWLHPGCLTRARERVAR
jgi:hypothetical protein